MFKSGEYRIVDLHESGAVPLVLPEGVKVVGQDGTEYAAKVHVHGEHPALVT